MYRRAYRRQIQRLFAGVVRNTKTTTEVQHAHWCGRMRRERHRTGIAVLQQSHHSSGVQHLRTGVEMKTRKIDGQRRQQCQHLRRHFGVDAEGPWPTTHALACTTQLDIRIDAQRHTRTHGSGLARGGNGSQFAHAFALKQSIGGYTGTNLFQRFPGTGKANIEATGQGRFQR